MQKGIDCEQQSIDLLNNVEFRLSKPYVKTQERKSNEWITGECDIYDAETRTIRDIKTSSWEHCHISIVCRQCKRLRMANARLYDALGL